MDSIFRHYSDMAYPYDFERGPLEVRNREDAQQGLNCTALAHLVIHDLYDEALPATHLAYEMFSDTSNFAEVSGLEDLESGDLVWLGLANSPIDMKQFKPVWRGGYGANLILANWSECPVKHVGIYTGEADEGDPLILHSSRYLGKCAIEPLSAVCSRPKHAKIHAMKHYLDNQSRMIQAKEHEQRMFILGWRLA